MVSGMCFFFFSPSFVQVYYTVQLKVQASLWESRLLVRSLRSVVFRVWLDREIAQDFSKNVRIHVTKYLQ